MADAHVWVVALDVGAAGPDVATVDAVARAALAARRHGWTVQVTGADEDLTALLDLCGLPAAVPDVLVLAPVSAVGVVGQPEEVEEALPEEDGDVRDEAT